MHDIGRWFNVHNEPVIGITVTTPACEVFLLESIDTSGYAHDAQFLTRTADNSLRKIEAEMQCHIRSIITDNAANVTKMRHNLRKLEGHRNLMAYGCTAHILNLLAHDL